ncbi:MAG: hypothetical protein LBH68_01935, partial [Bifidobacteriaceae bacterium]|nr:hypothetical protein [Bifidobacteriaceae bacterium]
DHEYRPPTGYGTNAAVYAVLSSDPTKTDSDGDGYGDKTEVTWHETHPGARHPDPMVSDVDTYQLSNPNYVAIGLKKSEISDRAIKNGKENDFPSYGGNQEWFYDAEGKGDISTTTAKNLAQRGCGIIAMVDLISYIGSTSLPYGGLAGPIRESNAFGGFSPLSYAAYYDFVYKRIPRMMKLQISTPFVAIDLPSTGVPPAVYKDMVDTYFRSNTGSDTFGVRVRWWDGGAYYGSSPSNPAAFDSEAEFGRVIRRNIGSDFPVTLLNFYNGGIHYYSDSSVHVLGDDLWIDRNRDGHSNASDYPGYRVAGRGNSINPGDNYFNLDLVESPTGLYYDHYVNVTGYTVDRIDGKKKLTISSWGTRHVVELSNVEEWFGRYGRVYEVQM